MPKASVPCRRHDSFAGGASEAQILEDFPDLQAEDIRASLQYAAAQANHAVLQAA